MPFVASLSPDQEKYAAREYRKGRGLRDIGNELGVSLHTIRRCVARQHVPVRARGGGRVLRDAAPDEADLLRKLYADLPAARNGRQTGQAGDALADELRRLNADGVRLSALAEILGMSAPGVHHIIYPRRRAE